MLALKHDMCVKRYFVNGYTFCQEYILRLQVSVKDILAMNMPQRQQNLHKPA